MADLIPMIAPDGTPGEIPHDKVADAVKANFKIGTYLVSQSGERGIVPMDKVHDAINAGFRLQGAAPPGPPKVDMQEHNVLENPDQVGKPSAGPSPGGKLGGLIHPHTPSYREGVGDVMLAATPLAALGTPVQLAKGLIGGGVGSQVARKGAELFGAGPTTTDLAETAGGVVGGMASQMEMPNAGPKGKAVGKLVAQDLFSKIPVVGRAVRRPSFGDYWNAATTEPPAAPSAPDIGLNVGKPIKRLPNGKIDWQGMGMDKPDFRGPRTNPPGPTTPEQVQATKDVVSSALPDAPKATQMRTQAQVDFYLKKGNVEAAQNALETAKNPEFKPPAPSRTTNQIRADQPEAQRARFRDTVDDSGVSQELNQQMQQHGYLAESEARKEFIARNSTGVTKGDLVKAAGGSVPEKPVRYTKNVVPKANAPSPDAIARARSLYTSGHGKQHIMDAFGLDANTLDGILRGDFGKGRIGNRTIEQPAPPAGTTVPQTSEEMTAALQKSVERARPRKLGELSAPDIGSPARPVEGLANGHVGYRKNGFWYLKGSWGGSKGWDWTRVTDPEFQAKLDASAQ